MSFWLCGRHACTQYSKCGLTRLLYKAMMFLFDLFSYVRLISPTNLFMEESHKTHRPHIKVGKDEEKKKNLFALLTHVAM